MLTIGFLQRSLQLKQRPYSLLLFTSILLFIGGFISNNIAIDIHIHDSYFIFSRQFLIWFTASILLTFYLLYLGTHQMLYSSKITWLHIFLSVAKAVFVFALPYFYTSSTGTGAGSNYVDYANFSEISLIGSSNNMIVNAISCLIIFQLLYFINFFIGFFLRVKRLGKI